MKLIRKPTIILLCILLVAVAALLLVKQINDRQTQLEPTSIPDRLSEETSSASLDEIDVSLAHGGITITFVRDTLNQEWTYIEQENATVDQGYVEQMVAALYSLEPTTQLDAAGGLEQYGLDDPVMKYVLKYKDGSTVAVSFGDFAPTTGDYYMLKNDEAPMIVGFDSVKYLILCLNYAVSSASSGLQSP